MNRRFVRAFVLTVVLGASGALRAAEPLRVAVRPVGVTEEERAALAAAVPKLPAVSERLGGSAYRLLSVATLEPESKLGASERPDRFRAVLYDYTANQGIEVIGGLDSKTFLPIGTPRISDLARQPNPSEEEFDAAVRELTLDRDLGPKLARGALVPYRPMPPVLDDEKPGEKQGRVERTIHVGLAPAGAEPASSHEIVGVNLVSNRIVRFAGRAPGRAIASPTACGPASGACGGATCNPAGTTGYELVVTRGAEEIWRFTVTRPSASSGTDGSAVELTNVYYRGKTVLARAHVPILNVKYNGACGPYRDWQDSETTFQATGTPVSGNSWLMNASSPPTSILETGNDAGTHRGVAYYVGANDVVVLSELTAGWYRYVSSWRFLDDGTIQPRFGFGAVSNSCVCIAHNHHVYWRFDFDLGGAANDAVHESTPTGSFTQATVEKWGRRERAGGKRLLVQDKVTRDAYLVVPGAYDGVADTYGRGDYWLLRGKGSTEFDDGGCRSGTEANLTACFVNGESIDGQDVVVWYGGHYLHNFNDTFNNFNHYVGPDLVVSSW